MGLTDKSRVSVGDHAVRNNW